MMDHLYGICIAFLIPLVVCVYYAEENLKEVSGFKKKLEVIFKRSKTEYMILSISCLACLGTYFISHHVYQHADVFWTYRWEIAMGILVPIAVIDFKYQIIPNKLLLIGLVFGVVTIALQVVKASDYVVSVLGNAFIGMIAGGGIFFLASVFVRNGIGAGDIKMFLFLGLLVAFRGIFNVLLYSMVVSAITAIILVICKKKTMKDELPLAPFTLIGVVISILFGV